MKTQELIRKVFQTLAVILFTIQIHQSVRKYFSYPVVVQTSQVPVKDLPSPVVYVCQADQFNYTQARKYGYQYESRFMAGILNSSFISWSGRYGNLTYDDLENLIYGFNYTTLKVGVKSDPDKEWNYDHHMQTISLYPQGVCKKLQDVPAKPLVRITTKKADTIFFVDPARANDIRTEQTLDAQVTIGPSSNTHYEFGSVEVEYAIHDDSILTGITCNDYTNSHTSYANCLKTIHNDVFLSKYRCLPPWVTTNDTKKTCTKAMNIETSTIYGSTVYNVVKELVNNKEVGMFKKCLPPCITTTMKIQKLRYDKNSPTEAYLEIISKEVASVHKQVYSYDIFSLTVDLGSALGLWMGLSCLSILDHILANWISVKKYLKR